MDVGRPVAGAHAHRLPVSLETVALTTGEQAHGAGRCCPPPAGRGRHQDVLLSHHGGTTHLWGERGRNQEMNLIVFISFLEKYLLGKHDWVQHVMTSSFIKYY